MLIGGMVLSVLGAVGLVMLLYVAPRLAERLRTEGIRRTAKVLDIKVGTGRIPQYFADLEVEMEDGSKRVILSVLAPPALREQGGVGSTWTIYQLPDQPNEVYPGPDQADPRKNQFVWSVLVVMAAAFLGGGAYLIFRAVTLGPGR